MYDDKRCPEHQECYDSDCAHLVQIAPVSRRIDAWYLDGDKPFFTPVVAIGLQHDGVATFITAHRDSMCDDVGIGLICLAYDGEYPYESIAEALKPAKVKP